MVRAASSGLWSAPPQRAARGPAVVSPGNGYWRYRTAGPFLLARRRRAADPRRHLPRAEFRYDAQAADSSLLRAKVWSRRSGPPRVRYRALAPERQPAGRLAKDHRWPSELPRSTHACSSRAKMAFSRTASSATANPAPHRRERWSPPHPMPFQTIRVKEKTASKALLADLMPAVPNGSPTSCALLFAVHNTYHNRLKSLILFCSASAAALQTIVSAFAPAGK